MCANNVGARCAIKLGERCVRKFGARLLAEGRRGPREQARRARRRLRASLPHRGGADARKMAGNV